MEKHSEEGETEKRVLPKDLGGDRESFRVKGEAASLGLKRSRDT